jgi:hypothetical protein
MKKSKLQKLINEIHEELNQLSHEQLIEELVKVGKHPLTKYCLELHKDIKKTTGRCMCGYC